MTTKKFFAVEVFDNTCNVMGHESGIYGKGDYSWITDTLNGGDGAEYNMTEAEALEVKADFEQKIKEYMLDWASVEIDSVEVEVDDEPEDEPKRTIKIADVIDTIRKNEVGVMSIVLEDASRYAANAKGELTCVGTLFTKKYANRQEGDEVIQTGNKETNLSAVERQLRTFMGKGNVYVKLLNPNLSMYGEVIA